MLIQYDRAEAFPGWDKAPEFLEALIREHQPTDLLEIGSGANPTLSPERVRALGLTYTTNDLDAEELEKADDAFEALQLDLCKPLPAELVGAYDLVFSRMVNEHVRDGRSYYENIFRSLRPGGVTAHCFSTLYALPFLVNRLVPEAAADALLNFFQPRDRHQHERFQAFYSWSRGPSRSAIRRFEELGFEVLEYRGYFGHTYYRNRLGLLHRMEKAKSDWLVRHPLPLLTSYGTVVLRKPSQ